MKKTIGSILIIICIISGMLFSVSADENRMYLGETTKTGWDNGYNGSNDIGRNDPHYGWSLGRFYIEGYTSSVNDSNGNPVFLKTLGNTVTLGFRLDQDIDELNGQSGLSIGEDVNGYDQYFGTARTNCGRGLLIIRKTDYQNNYEEPIIYTDYLSGVSVGADTVVEVFEEGDYEVALDYEIRENHINWDLFGNNIQGAPTFTNYRIYFRFSVRNGNCMVFPFDVVTGEELQNQSFTDNGFSLDLARSRYLNINVQRSVFVEGNNGYTEDVRFNRPASDGYQYTDEGVYTITVSNQYTGQETEKVIYVGSDPIMRAYAVTGYSLNEIQEMLLSGCTISDDGRIVTPTPTPTLPPDETLVEQAVETVAEDADDVTPSIESTVATVQLEVESSEDTIVVKKGGAGKVIAIILVLIVLGGGGVAGYMFKDKIFAFIGKKGDKPESEKQITPINETTDEEIVNSSLDDIRENEDNSEDEEIEDSEENKDVTNAEDDPPSANDEE